MTNEKLLRFTDLMKEIFELNKSDLDFGIYKIMNVRKNEIESFLKNELPIKINGILSEFKFKNDDEINRIKEIEGICNKAGIEVKESKMAEEYRLLLEKIEQQLDFKALETDVYSALYNFFNRYYSEGDFISKRRYKNGVYSIPYSGEEVKLYWANEDQYYIKTSENFVNYTFTENERTVHFNIVAANTEQNNNVENTKRVFMLFEEDDEEYPGIKTFSQEKSELYINFTYDIPKLKKKNYFDENVKLITQAVATEYRDFYFVLRDISTDKKKVKSLLEKHLESYVAKNTFDYFIHKDLESFLERELEYYIKNEILHLDDIDTNDLSIIEAQIVKLKCIREVGKIIIEFLSHIENFQKKLWLKKKFIIETDWFITLDKIPKVFYEEILNNPDQIDDWENSYLKNGKFTYDISLIEKNPYLIVDTKFFTTNFKERLIASFENLEESTTGIMIHSENYQALNFLNAKYKNEINLVYIDPPYNTDASKILYKNGYEHSSWISLMASRLELARELLNNRGIIQVAIDDYEFRYTNILLDQLFGINNAISNVAILTNPKGRDQEFIAQAHDYTLMYAKNKSLAETNNFILTEEEIKRKYSKIKGGQQLRELPLKRTGSDKRREDRQYMYFPFIHNPVSGETFVVREEEYKRIYNPETDTFDDEYVERLKLKYESIGNVLILPLSGKGEKWRWRWGYKSSVKGLLNGELFVKQTKKGNYAVYQYDIADNEETPKSLWLGERYDASSKGTNILENIIPNNPFDFPKSIYTVEDNLQIGSKENGIILDYFGGSGTTAHAVINLNRNTKSNRKFIIIEMGEYFEKVTKERVKRVSYSDNWKNGVPQNTTSGISQMVKYFKLESYEDTLSNIELSDETNKSFSFFGEEYLVKYYLDYESKDSLLNLEEFKNPFSYELKFNENNSTRVRVIDLVETFNYMLGIKVYKQDYLKSFDAKVNNSGQYSGAVTITESEEGEFSFKYTYGEILKGEKVLIVWRNYTEDIQYSNAILDAFILKLRNDYKEVDYIYVNGDSNIAALREFWPSCKVLNTEVEFKKLMFMEEYL